MFADRAARHGVDADDVIDATDLRGPDRIVDLTLRTAPVGRRLRRATRAG